MISLDTNVIVRIVVKDDKEQLASIRKLFAQLDTSKQQAYVPLLVILEVNWVLSAFYEVSRAEIIENLLMLLSTPILHIENHDDLKQLLINAKENTFDLSDLLIGLRCEVAGNTPVMTFDKKASRFSAFALLA